MNRKQFQHIYSYNIKRSAHFLHFRQIKSSRTSDLICLFLYGIIPLIPFFFLLNFCFPRKSFKGDIAFVLTSNQRNIAEILQKKFNYKIYDWSKTGILEKVQISLSLLSDINFIFLISEIKNHEVIKSNIFNVLKTIGLYNSVSRYKLEKVNKYYQFNDHSPINFGLEDIFRSKGIKTAYIQHAPVSEEFPALYHSHNFLFSEDSKAKYKISNKCDTIEVIYDPRFAFREAYITKPIEKKVLLCPNLLDDKNQVITTANALQSMNFQVLIRKHPGDKSKWPNKFHFSDNQNIWNDLAHTYWVVTNESAVTLEAIFNGNLLFKATFWSKPLDSYGFLKKSLLLKEYFNLEDLLQAIHNEEKSFDSNKLEYFIGKCV